MRVNEFRRQAAKMDQHMQQLAAQGVHDAPAILHRMMGYAPELHRIWVGTTDEQLLALAEPLRKSGYGTYLEALVREADE